MITIHLSTPKNLKSGNKQYTVSRNGMWDGTVIATPDKVVIDYDGRHEMPEIVARNFERCGFTFE